MKKMFNEEKGLIATGGDKELLSELIALFKKESVNQLADICSAIENAKADKISSAVHKIKGSLSALGAGCASETARMLESQASENNIENAKTLFGQLREEVGEFLLEAARYCKGAKV